MRILLISYFFPPYNTIGAVRAGKAAKFLSALGHDVRVVAANDLPLPATLPLEIPPALVEYTGWVETLPPWRRHKRGQRGSHPASSGQRGAEAEARGAGRATPPSALRRWVAALVTVPDAQIGWGPFALRAGANLVRSWKPDVLLASATPYTGLLVAARLSRRSGIPWVAEMRDLWVDHHDRSLPAWRDRVDRPIENRVLGSASALVTVSEPLARTLRARYSLPVHIITNGFDRDDYPPAHGKPATATIDILYAGSLYAGHQDPSPLFEALRSLGEDRVRFRVRFFGRDVGVALGLAERFGVADLVETNAPVSYRASLSLQVDADILLLLSWDGPTGEGVFTGKLFEYVGARRPILAVGSVDNVASALIRERSLGVAANAPSEIARALRGWLQEKDRLGYVQAPPAEAGLGLSRFEQNLVLEEALCAVAGLPRSTTPRGRDGQPRGPELGQPGSPASEG